MDFNALYVVVATLLVLMIVGFACRKLRIIDDVASKKLSALILKVGQPAMIINALAGAKYSIENLEMAGKMVVFGFAYHIGLAILAFGLAFVLKKNIDEQKISEFSLIFANCAFIGFPIFEALFGTEGLFMASFLVISFNIFMWTWGLAIFARKRNDIKITVKKVFLNFGTVPSAIGFGLFALQAPEIGFVTPAFLLDACKFLSNLCTPISVLITGALIATKPLKEFFTRPKLYYLSFMKLIVLPLLVCAIMALFNFDADTIIFCTVAAAMPSAAVATMFGSIYSISPSYASQAVGFTTLLSVGTMPLIMLIVPKIIEIL
jgi:predicted permease